MHPFHYIVVIDRSQAGQTLFLKAIAKGASKHTGLRGIFLHTDNERTEDLIQEGTMRGDARKRVLKETNRRLIDLFAEAGVGCVGLQWHQVGNIDAFGALSFVNDPRTRIPHSTHLILSNLVNNEGDVEELSVLAKALSNAMSVPVLHVTSARLDGVFVKKADDTAPDELGGGQDLNGAAQHISMDSWNALNDFIRGI